MKTSILPRGLKASIAVLSSLGMPSCRITVNDAPRSEAPNDSGDMASTQPENTQSETVLIPVSEKAAATIGEGTYKVDSKEGVGVLVQHLDESKSLRGWAFFPDSEETQPVTYYGCWCTSKFPCVPPTFKDIPWPIPDDFGGIPLRIDLKWSEERLLIKAAGNSDSMEIALIEGRSKIKRSTDPHVEEALLPLLFLAYDSGTSGTTALPVPCTTSLQALGICAVGLGLYKLLSKAMDCSHWNESSGFQWEC